MKGEHKPGYTRRRAGEKPKVRQPLKVDKLSQETRDAILKARAEGRTWEETAESASKIAGQEISVGACYRWYDIRVEQVLRETAEMDKLAEKNLRKFFGRTLAELPEAAAHSLKAEVYGMQSAKTSAQREASIGNFLALLSKLLMAQAMQQRVGLEKDKLDARRESLQAQSPREVYLAAVEELLKKLRTRKAVREVLDPIAKELIEELSKSAESFTRRIEAQQS